MSNIVYLVLYHVVKNEKQKTNGSIRNKIILARISDMILSNSEFGFGSFSVGSYSSIIYLIFCEW